MTIEQIFNIFNELEKDKFELFNLSNQFELKIKLGALEKEKELTIFLEPKSEPKEEIIQILINNLNNQACRIESLEKEIKYLLGQKKPGEKPDKEKTENNIQRIDKSIINIGANNKNISIKECIKPPFLKPKDKVAIVSPAGAIDPSLIDSACTILISWGLVPIIGT